MTLLDPSNDLMYRPQGVFPFSKRLSCLVFKKKNGFSSPWIKVFRIRERKSCRLERQRTHFQETSLEHIMLLPFTGRGRAMFS